MVRKAIQMMLSKTRQRLNLVQKLSLVKYLLPLGSRFYALASMVLKPLFGLEQLRQLSPYLNIAIALNSLILLPSIEMAFVMESICGMSSWRSSW